MAGREWMGRPNGVSCVAPFSVVSSTPACLRGSYFLPSGGAMGSRRASLLSAHFSGLSLETCIR